jgi:hypothetical protein
MLAAAAAFALLSAGCRDERPSEADIARLLETSANNELSMHRMRAGGAGGQVPDAVRIVNLKTIGAVTDTGGVYVASVQFDLMVELGGARTLSQRGAKARLKVARNGSSWRIVERQ